MSANRFETGGESQEVHTTRNHAPRPRRRGSRIALAIAPVAILASAVSACSGDSDQGSPSTTRKAEAPPAAPPKTEAKETVPKVRLTMLWHTDTHNSFAANDQLRDEFCAQAQKPIGPDPDVLKGGVTATGAILDTQLDTINAARAAHPESDLYVAYTWPKTSKYINGPTSGTGYGGPINPGTSSNQPGLVELGVTAGANESCPAFVLMARTGVPTVVDVIPTKVDPASIAEMNSARPPVPIA